MAGSAIQTELLQISSVAHFRTKPPRYFEGRLEFFATFQRFDLFIHSTTSRETPNDVPRNPGWETQIYNNAPRPVCKYPAAKGNSHVDKLLFKATKLCNRLVVEHRVSG